MPRESGENHDKTTAPEPHTGFKAKVALAAIKGDRTLAQLAEQFDVHPTRSHRGKRSLRAGLPMFLVPAAATEQRSRRLT
jgi:transposase-like protein